MKRAIEGRGLTRIPRGTGDWGLTRILLTRILLTRILLTRILLTRILLTRILVLEKRSFSTGSWEKGQRGSKKG
jgi:hypothetical protein